MAGWVLLPSALEDARVLLSKKTVRSPRINLVGRPPLDATVSSSCRGEMKTLYPSTSSIFSCNCTCYIYIYIYIYIAIIYILPAVDFVISQSLV